MKKKVLFFFVYILFSTACTRGPYIDGCYTGKSQAGYDYEPYVGYVTVTIKNGWPIKADFKIVDTAKNELFNDKYEKYFEGNERYINQCRNDWKGVQTYPGLYIKNKDLEKVDAVSGATWSFNFFKSATVEALKKAKR